MVLLPDPFWKGPADRTNPDEVFGLASEFGCDEQGDRCTEPGLNGVAASTNGVLGWEDDDLNEFIKIGVGRLKKPNCSEVACPDDPDVYNSSYPYELATEDEDNLWRVVAVGNTITMKSTVKLNVGNESRYGYELEADVTVIEDPPKIEITTILRNIGQELIRTPHYSRNSLNIKKTFDRSSDDDINGNWTVTLESIEVNRISNQVPTEWNSSIVPKSSTVDGVAKEVLTVVRPLTVSAPMRVEFANDEKNLTDANSDWSVEHKGNNITIRSREIINTTKDADIYRYLFYASKYELAPVPVRIIDIQPGETAKLTRTIEFDYKGNTDQDNSVWLPEGWMLMTAIAMMLGSTGISLQCKKRAMLFMDHFTEKRKSEVV